MALDQFLGALNGNGSNNSNQGSGGQDPLSGLLGGILGGQASGQQDVMGQLLGGLLGGQAQNQPTAPNGQIGNVLGVLEGLMSSGSPAAAGLPVGIANTAASDPMMQMLTPLVDSLAAKVNIPPQIAVLVVSFVLHQVISSHPASGRESLVDVGTLQQQLNSGLGVSHDYLHSSGLVNQLVQQTGLDKKTASKSLKTVFDMLGQS